VISKYHLFVLIFIPAALALAAGMALIQQKNNDLSFAQFESQLKSQWRLAALITESPDGLAELMRLNDRQGLRATVVDENGEVLADSAAPGGGLDSHRDREEIRKAFAGTPATTLRLSRTTGAHSIYYAERLADGRVLRVAYPASYYDGRRNALMEQATTGLLALVAIVGAFAFIISRRSSAMLAALSRAVKEAQGGGLELPSFGNDDLDKALFSLSSANRELKLYGEENLQLQERLEYILANIEEGVILLVDDRIVYRNRRAEEILQFPLPGNLAAINSQEMMDVFASFRGGQTGELQLDDRTIVISQAVSDASRLIMLHDVSDREKYSGYKSDLVGNISHELKTPLALIMGASEVILKDADMPRAYLDKFLGTIYKNTQRINQLLDDLIFLHHLEGVQDSEAGETDLSEMIGDLQDLLGRVDKKVEYQFDPVEARIHATHLISVLTNLINNADKYSKGESIDVEVRKNNAVLEIRVSDQGPQIPPSETERIFERFYTVSKSRNRGASGSGLGLSIVKHIARLYQGQAQVEPNANGGNTFVVRLVEKPEA
jgi:two-component system phosphate regulon sensor histidine kinase PhoR